MSIKEIMEVRQENLRKEEAMWIELFNETYPIGKIMEIEGEEMEVVGYGCVQDIPIVKFEKLVRQQKSVFYFNLPGFKDGGEA